MAGLIAGVVVTAVLLIIPMKSSYIHELNEEIKLFSWLQLAVAALGAMAAFLVGLWDDLKSPPPLFKLGAQLIIAGLSALLIEGIPGIQIPFVSSFVEFPPVVGKSASFLVILLFMNVWNFMDGINGLVTRYTQLILAGLIFSILYYDATTPITILSVIVIFSCQGFVTYNIPSARTFMGDSGSQVLGYLVAILLIFYCITPTSYPQPVLGFLILCSVFLFDVLFTIIRRSLNGANPLHAHRDHLYQRYLAGPAGEDHTLTRQFVTSHGFVTVVLAYFYIHVGFDANRGILQILLIAGMSAVLLHYLLKGMRKTSADFESG